MLDIENYDLFKEYFFQNKGQFYKSFKIIIRNHQYNYDIYWGDPKIIFLQKSLSKKYPLAVTVIPHRNNYPKPRIFLHKDIKIENKYVFELIITHEIGHLWLHDILGYNNPSTEYLMEESESEIWADFFSYNFFKIFRNIKNIKNYLKLLKGASKVQMDLYNLNPKKYIEDTFNVKMKNLILLQDKVSNETRKENLLIIHMMNAMEITLHTLGDIFENP